MTSATRSSGQAIRSAVKLLNETGSYEAVLYLTEEKVKRREVAWRVEHAVLVAMDAVYRFEQMKSEPTEVRRPLRKLTLSVPQRSDLTAGEAASARGLAIAHGMDLAKDLGNLPGNVCTPRYLAERAQDLGKEFPDIKVTVLERPQIEALGMGSFLSVTNGSDEPPRFIVLEYDQAVKKQKPLVLVGKGITFDTGGISIKPAGDMDQMKFDMCGAASVLGAFRDDRRTAFEAQRRRAHSHVRKHAVGAGDQAGRHREVDVGTDDRGAEHRRRRSPDPRRRADVCRTVRAAGRRRRCDADRRDGGRAWSRRKRHLQQQRSAGARLIAAGDDAYDRGWQMPLWEDYQEGLASNFADFANVAGRAGGSITAACFLSRFARKYDWAHIDIAGIAWKEGKNKGSTGRPVPMLATWLLANESLV